MGFPARILLVFFISSAAAVRAVEPVPTLQECIRGLTNRSNHFLDAESVYIRCEWTNIRHLQLSELEDERLQLLLMDGRNSEAVALFPQQRIIRAPGYKYELALRNRRLFQRVTNPADLKFGAEGITGVYDGEFGLQLQGNDHAYVDQSPPAYAWQHWDYAFLLNINAFRHLKDFSVREQFPPALQPTFLPEAIVENQSEFTVEKSEDADGVECVVLARDGRTRWWLDPSRGWTPIRCEYYVAAAGGRQIVSRRLSMTDIREEKPGLWLPRRVIEEVCITPDRGGADSADWGISAVRSSLVVTQIEFDTITDVFFEVDIPPGAIVHDAVRNLDYKTDSGEGLPFQQAIELASSHVSSQRYSSLLLYLLNGLLAIAIVVFAVLRLRRGGPQS
jgi:hypothetical protein